MATLPDPSGQLSDADQATYDAMAAARAHAEGRPALGEVYVRMFNNAGVAAKVGALGEQLRFHGVLPDDVRELVILRYATREGFGYEWSHHQRPAQLAGISRAVIDQLTAGSIPSTLPAAQRAAIAAVDHVARKESIPAEVQQVIVDGFGTAGVVEVVALCGLYGLMGAMVTAFDIPVEDGLPAAPF